MGWMVSRPPPLRGVPPGAAPAPLRGFIPWPHRGAGLGEEIRGGCLSFLLYGFPSPFRRAATAGGGSSLPSLPCPLPRLPSPPRPHDGVILIADSFAGAPLCGSPAGATCG